jgi:hypothetical protein
LDLEAVVRGGDTGSVRASVDVGLWTHKTAVADPVGQAGQGERDCEGGAGFGAESIGAEQAAALRLMDVLVPNEVEILCSWRVILDN